MATYLNQLKSTLNQIQAEQITALLIGKKNSGEIKNLDEFRSELNLLTSQLMAEKISPTLEIILGDIDEIIDSRSYNFMLDRVKDDLTTCFKQATTLDEVLEDHTVLINNIILKSIKLGIANLESKIAKYEFLASSKDGFDNAQFNTFATTEQLRTSRASENAPLLFLDPRSKNPLGVDVSFDLSNDRILAGPLDDQTSVPVKSVRQIFDSESTQSVEAVNFSSNDINKIIDSTPGTYWIYSILENKILDNGAFVKLELNLEKSSNVNSIEIEPASLKPMEFVRIEYVDNNNAFQIIQINDLLTNKKRIQFPEINTDKLVVVFKQENAIEVQYEPKQSNDNFEKALLGEDSSVDLDSIKDEIVKVLRSNRILNDILVIDPTETQELKIFYEYIVGLDNITVQYTQFTEDSIFVSEVMTVDDITQIAVQAKDQRPILNGNLIEYTSDTHPEVDDGTFLGSIEYWGIMHSYNAIGQLVKVDKVPLFPLGKTSVSQERLLLTEFVGGAISANAGFLMFYPDLNIGNIRVYKNGELLTEGLNWNIDSSLSNTLQPPTGIKNKVAIRISNPVSSAFYTVSYTPDCSNTRANPSDIQDFSLLKVIDLEGDASIKMGCDNIIYVDAEKREKKNIDITKLYLVAILRRNTSDVSITPIVDEYLLLSSSVVKDKFGLF